MIKDALLTFWHLYLALPPRSTGQFTLCISCPLYCDFLGRPTRGNPVGELSCYCLPPVELLALRGLAGSSVDIFRAFGAVSVNVLTSVATFLNCPHFVEDGILGCHCFIVCLVHFYCILVHFIALWAPLRSPSGDERQDINWINQMNE